MECKLYQAPRPIHNVVSVTFEDELDPEDWRHKASATTWARFLASQVDEFYYVCVPTYVTCKDRVHTSAQVGAIDIL
jgi:hypothetical protein